MFFNDVQPLNAWLPITESLFLPAVMLTLVSDIQFSNAPS